LVATDPTLLADLKGLVEPVTRGDPMAPLLWTARACATWRVNSARSAIASAITWWPTSCAAWLQPAG